jgi:predicted nucleic acid-binding protein
LAVLFDTSISIAALRLGENAVPALGWMGDSPVWLSSVVMEELFSGANSRQISLLEQIERDFEPPKANHLTFCVANPFDVWSARSVALFGR